jgi:hypothetical protein
MFTGPGAGLAGAAGRYNALIYARGMGPDGFVSGPFLISDLETRGTPQALRLIHVDTPSHGSIQICRAK